ncbi:MAG: ABC transporter substrate-binding protein, partial [Notoacmeibacter sp.]|nr:ABC transporter substrate-binding protein [Notoacmeibacter sp.]
MQDQTRRQFLTLAGSAALLPLTGLPGLAALPAETPLHGLSAFGELKYGPAFTHFAYANLAAPKGGTFNFSPPNWAFNQGAQTFDTLNSFTFRGNAPMRMELCFDALMTRALDEPDAIYGLLAESVTISPDRKTYRFLLRENARFHDGSPVTAQDVAFSYQTFKTPQAHPSLSQPLRELNDAVAVDERTVDLVFSGQHSDRTILTAATFPILQKA